MNSRNDGFTLVEILIVTLLSAVVMGSIHQMIIMQDRTTREQYAIVETQQNTRNALAVVTADLKEISAADGDVIYADSMDLQFRALRKAGLACNKEPGNNTIDVAELGAPFVQGDQVLLFADGTNPASSLDDTWLQLGVSMVGAGNCAANPLNASAITRLTFTGTPLANVQVGALVRSFIQTRYRIIDNGEFGQLMRTEGGTETAIVENLATITDGIDGWLRDARGLGMERVHGRERSSRRTAERRQHAVNRTL